MSGFFLGGGEGRCVEMDNARGFKAVEQGEESAEVCSVEPAGGVYNDRGVGVTLSVEGICPYEFVCAVEEVSSVVQRAIYWHWV